ncbi:L-ribulose-5-phosphate 3-epimerase UlaE [Pseudobythopirellula maris]|uniref:L-ribulose-5-phosphate 3-epimerase UlaE n=1 Tax=Pseudobythopirellula maris TaxID=2527991 RepID=A0A5C5ZJP3_9BACT|nr:sugar phosphate isomerase/epimerase family protein [Pseudobythopirellula maris]TWT87388.1 L-ribulose-5-phosphate 3-epimerase UlaE [Pseudobythopirellula maris]
MHLSYNTNGLAHHAPLDAMDLLAEIGYRGVAITIDHGVLNPLAHGLKQQTAKLRSEAERLGLKLSIETGARFLLDPRTKHEPTLVSADPGGRERRVDFYRRAIDLAADLGATCVSVWSGVVHDNADREAAIGRLVPGLVDTLEHAAARGVAVAFEPEPGMLIATLADYAGLKERLGPDGESLRLTIDIGHLHCQGETPIADLIERFADDLVNVHIEDMRAGAHEHLPFGEGEIDFPPVVAALQKIGYDGPLAVELSRHSHDGPRQARAAYDFLAPLLRSSP